MACYPVAFRFELFLISGCSKLLYSIKNFLHPTPDSFPAKAFVFECLLVLTTLFLHKDVVSAFAEIRIEFSQSENRYNKKSRQLFDGKIQLQISYSVTKELFRVTIKFHSKKNLSELFLRSLHF